MPTDVLIIGAGAAGLSAALDLARNGVSLEILEARGRVGGRVFTKHDPTLNHPMELGAEFVHGLAPEIWLPLQEHKLKVTEVEGDSWCSIAGKLERCNFFGKADKILSSMDDTGSDESFLNFVSREFPGKHHAEAKRWATGYVSGFNAADPGLVSVHWLVHSRNADEQIEGDRAFRIVGGYEKPMDIFSEELKRLHVPIHLNTIVRGVKWGPDSVEISASVGRKKINWTAPRALVTLPLGVLQSPRSVSFDPQLPKEKQNALRKLAMGKVVRVSLCFRERFWEALRGLPDSRSLSNLSFLFSRDKAFPTWWTQMPDEVPVITGWSPACSAEDLKGKSERAIVSNAVAALSRLLHLKKSQVQSQLRAAYFHDWDSDPFSRGAYSYVKVGGEGCQKILASPIRDTLFFAGEATDISGHNGTVHGAIASGKRAAEEILKLQ